MSQSSLQFEIISTNSIQLSSDLTVLIPECRIKFKEWKGKPLNETFGGKTILNVDGKPMFAELAIMHKLLKDDWEVRWIETYGKANMNPIFLTEWKDEPYKNQLNVPIANERIIELLNGIAKENNNSFYGCWDILAWKNEQIIFAESKRKSKDQIRQTQINWLAAALRYGLKPENFLVIEWEIKALIAFFISYSTVLSFRNMNYCCPDMKKQIELKCDLHNDVFDCPDRLVYYSTKQKSFGLIVHDGGSSFIVIHFCPWCGKKLSQKKSK